MDWLLAHYVQVEKRLKRLLRRSGRSKEDAEDLIQEALLRLQEYCRSGTVEDQQAFLVRTVRNLVVDWHRRDQHHLFDEQSVEEWDAAAPFVDTGPMPDEIFAAQERLNTIRVALDAVSPRTREIYFAHRAGFSYEEIGAELRISKSAIEKHIARAVLALMDLKESE